jgi:hypothetical protein
MSFPLFFKKQKKKKKKKQDGSRSPLYLLAVVVSHPICFGGGVLFIFHFSSKGLLAGGF